MEEVISNLKEEPDSPTDDGIDKDWSVDFLADEYGKKNKYRYTFAICYGGVALIWILFVGYIFVANTYDCFPNKITDKVLMVLLGSATVNAQAPAIIIARYLFSSKS